ncbi:MAG: DUF485 domain-containing protein [Gammaproteobacteria bacterium]|nr:DUF485 domain-containing protein [Gammaproteobacteria bacterium]
MSNGAERLNDPDLQQIIRRRSLLRWSFSGVILGVYLLWGICGVYFADFYAAPFFGNTLPTGLAIGFMIIALAMIMSIVYVRLTNKVGVGDREPSA